MTGRTDQYALAAVAFGLLAGRRPFEGDTTASLAARVLYEEAPNVTTLNPSLPSALDTVFRRAFSKMPSARYDTCSQFADALRSALVTTAPAVPGVPTLSTTSDSSTQIPKPPRKINWGAPVLLLVMLAVAGVGIWLYQRNNAAQLEIAYWMSIKDSKTSDPFDEYLHRYPNGQFATLARVQARALKETPTQTNPHQPQGDKTSISTNAARPIPRVNSCK